VTVQLTIATVAPRLFNPNGDSENARVLARRCEWSGIAARVVEVASVGDLPGRVDAFVIGSCSDSDISAALAVLHALRSPLSDAVDAGVPVLAVGTGLELLTDEVTTPTATHDGLALVSGSASARVTRATGDLVVDSGFGRLVGYENHARDLDLQSDPLGRVVAGSGNGDGREGVAAGSLFGTHLHGPVLAKNPALADHLLGLAARRADIEYHPSGVAGVADRYAADARRAILDSLTLGE
jgi:CobQ-like glutamine amidotransferase family enzyme